MSKAGGLFIGKIGILFAGLLTVIFVGGLVVSVYLNSRSSSKAIASEIAEADIRVFTLQELQKYDGSNPELPIYLALEGLIYDVTDGKKFYAPGGSYHNLAGKDSTEDLRIFGGDIIKRKYPVIGRLETAKE